MQDMFPRLIHFYPKNCTFVQLTTDVNEFHHLPATNAAATWFTYNSSDPAHITVRNFLFCDVGGTRYRIFPGTKIISDSLHRNCALLKDSSYFVASNLDPSAIVSNTNGYHVMTH